MSLLCEFSVAAGGSESHAGWFFLGVVAGRSAQGTRAQSSGYGASSRNWAVFEWWP